MNLNPEISALDVPYVVFDFETTGLDPEKEKIIEIGAVKLEKTKQVDVFQSFVNPLKSIPAQATAINGLTDEDVSEAPTLDEVLPVFLRFIQNSVLVAHNSNFDCRFLSQVLKKFQISDLDNYILDTLTFSQRLFPQHGDHSLKAITQRLNLVNKKAHRAYEDAEVTAKVLIEFLTHMNLKGNRTFRQVAVVHGVPLGRVKGNPNGQSVKGFIENMSSSLF